MKMQVAKVVVGGLAVRGVFDYSIPQELEGLLRRGSRVKVDFGNAPRIGYVVGRAPGSRRELKSIHVLLDKEPVLTEEAMVLSRAVSRYYGCAWAEALELFLPPALREGYPLPEGDVTVAPPLESSAGSAAATARAMVRSLHRRQQDFFLLQDPSGEGRWQIYETLLLHCLNKNVGALLLFPDSASLQQASQRLSRLPPEALVRLGGRLKKKEQTALYARLKAGVPRLAMGLRSSAFLPLKDLSLIVVDEEQESSYKNEQAPYYHASLIARLRAEYNKAVLVWTYQSLSIEAYFYYRQKKARLVRLADRLSPALKVMSVDLRQERTSKKGGRLYLSRPLEAQVQKTLAQGGRSILFINRKGFARFGVCASCGAVLSCPQCQAALVYYYRTKELVCRFCNFRREVVQVCPSCGKGYVRFIGAGTEKIESELSRLFPQAAVGRCEKNLDTVTAQTQILVATQCLFQKQHELKAETVGVLSFEEFLSHVDFKAGEKAFSLLFKLLHYAQESFVLQTYIPEHYCLKAIQRLNPFAFYRKELGLRKGLGLPPFAHLMYLRIKGRDEEKLHQLSADVLKCVRRVQHLKGVFGPLPDIPYKLRGSYRHIIGIRVDDVERAVELLLKRIPYLRAGRRFAVNLVVDPV